MQAAALQNSAVTANPHDGAVEFNSTDGVAADHQVESEGDNSSREKELEDALHFQDEFRNTKGDASILTKLLHEIPECHEPFGDACKIDTSFNDSAPSSVTTRAPTPLTRSGTPATSSTPHTRTSTPQLVSRNSDASEQFSMIPKPPSARPPSARQRPPSARRTRPGSARSVSKSPDNDSGRTSP